MCTNKVVHVLDNLLKINDIPTPPMPTPTPAPTSLRNFIFFKFSDRFFGWFLIFYFFKNFDNNFLFFIFYFL